MDTAGDETVCGIAGLIIKDPEPEPQVGALLTKMTSTLCSRGPGSAGFAIYGPSQNGELKLTIAEPAASYDIGAASEKLCAAVAPKASVSVHHSHAVDALEDSLYETRIYVRGPVASLGVDCIEKQMRDEHKAELHEMLKASGEAVKVDVADFRRYGSARKLYNFNIDNAGAY
jgi:glutamate synthase domain-containing protein 1